MDQNLTHWINQVVTSDIRSCFICRSVGPIYLGAKPLEILSVTEKELQNCRLLKSLIEYKVIDKAKNRFRLIIFNRSALEETILYGNKLQFLHNQNYPLAFNVDCYIEELIYRIRNNPEGFPHEIGIFLGYPLKDVLGFMKIVDLPQTDSLGWKVYGNPNPSKKIYKKVKEAKDLVFEYSVGVQRELALAGGNYEKSSHHFW